MTAYVVPLIFLTVLVVAVFRKASPYSKVDEKSVPCDAVFYGATITTDVYNPAGYGYRIPDNDLYSTKNLLQPRSYFHVWF